MAYKLFFGRYIKRNFLFLCAFKQYRIKVVLGFIVLLYGCATTDEYIINPNGLPLDSLATIVGAQDSRGVGVYVEKLYSGNELVFTSPITGNVRKVMVESGDYSLVAHCLRNGGYAYPSMPIVLKGGERYRAQCNVCNSTRKSMIGLQSPVSIAKLKVTRLLNIHRASFQLVLKDAEFGNAKAQLTVAEAYYDGITHDGTELKHDFNKAYAWASLARSQKERGAGELISKIIPNIRDFSIADALVDNYFTHYWLAELDPCSGDEGVIPTQYLEVKTESRNTKIIFYNQKGWMHNAPIAIEVNGAFVKKLQPNEYVQIFLATGQYNLRLRYVDAFTFNTDYELEVGSEKMYLKVFDGLVSAKYEAQDELPQDFREKYIRVRVN